MELPHHAASLTRSLNMLRETFFTRARFRQGTDLLTAPASFKRARESFQCMCLREDSPIQHGTVRCTNDVFGEEHWPYDAFGTNSTNPTKVSSCFQYPRFRLGPELIILFDKVSSEPPDASSEIQIVSVLIDFPRTSSIICLENSSRPSISTVASLWKTWIL